MSRILTGIQSTNVPHLGNILGAMLPAIEMSKDAKNEALLFIADLHSLTTVKDADFRRSSTLSVALTDSSDIDSDRAPAPSKYPLNIIISYFFRTAC